MRSMSLSRKPEFMVRRRSTQYTERRFACPRNRRKRRNGAAAPRALTGSPLRLGAGKRDAVELAHLLPGLRIEQLERLVAADARKLRPIAAKDRAEDPIDVVVADHDFLAVAHRKSAHRLVRAADRDLLAIG